MRLELKKIEDNPFRDFAVDPIDPAVVNDLKRSIKGNPAGFWPGVLCRKSEHNGIELVFGHHRIRAAIAAGIREVDFIPVISGISDAQMIRMYADENATQRGNSGTAIAGSVASAVRFLAKAIMTGEDIPGFHGISQRALECVSGNLASSKGLGAEIIVTFLEGIPSVTINSVQQQLANLKASGDYARIIRDIQEEIEEENKEAIKRAEAAEAARIKAEEEQRKAEQRQKEAEEARKKAAALAKAAKEEADKRRAEAAQKRAEEERQKADAMRKLADQRRKEAEAKSKEWDKLRTTQATAKKAADKAEERDKTFDFEGVARHLKLASHIAVFRDLATGPGAKPYLPVNKQEALAKRLVKELGDAELSGRSIRENFMSLLLGAKTAESKVAKVDRDAIARSDWNAKAKLYQDDFASHARGALAAAMHLAEHNKKRPRDVTLHMTTEFRNAVNNLEKAVALVKKAGVI
jgi:flagellar biosynthesis GTPase FlhF